MKTEYWIAASRPKTLPAAVVPVAVGTALAYAEGSWQWLPASICLGFALLMQVGSNFANDYLDGVRGLDGDERIGPQRAVASGWISAESMKRAAWLVLVLGFLLGCSLIFFGGWLLLPVGLACVACAWLYTGGPKPLAAAGLGDVFVILFFGMVAVPFTAYVQTGTFSGVAWLLGFGVGLMVNNILVINNYRDADQDRKAGKRTLAVRWGRAASLLQYQLSITIASLIPVALLMQDYSAWILLAVLVYPAGRFLTMRISRLPINAGFNRALGWTSGLLVYYGAALALGLVLS